MLNELEEFRAYTKPPVYKADGKRDTTYMGRFTMDMILDFNGMARVLTILARGYLFAENADNPRVRIDYARRALCAWCSVPDKKKASPKEDWQFKSDFRELHSEFPELADKHGMGWFCCHVHSIVRFMKSNPDTVSKTAHGKADIIDKEFDAAWRRKVVQFQVPIFSQGTNGAWVLRFDDVLADALELGPLRNNSINLPNDILNRIEELRPEKVPAEVIRTLVEYYIANKPGDSEWVVLPVTNFDAYFGSTMFSRKWLPLIPTTLIVRERERMGMARFAPGSSIKLDVCNFMLQKLS